MELLFTVDKAETYREVAQTTAYTGKGLMAGDDPEAYDRVRTQEADASQLERFWREAIADMAQELKRVILSVREEEGTLHVDLEVSQAFDRALTGSMEMSLRSYFVQAITGRWFVFMNKGEAGAYADNAKVMLEDVKQKAFYKRKPRRPDF